MPAMPRKEKFRKIADKVLNLTNRTRETKPRMSANTDKVDIEKTSNETNTVNTGY